MGKSAIVLVTAIASVCLTTGCQNSDIPTIIRPDGKGEVLTAPQAVANRQPANDVASTLQSGRWEKREGLGRGMAWQYLDSGEVRIYDGGEIDESYRWEVLSRNESERRIRIRYWRPADSSNEHREFVFSFSPGGDTAQVQNWLHKNGQIELRGESTQYRIR